MMTLAVASLTWLPWPDVMPTAETLASFDGRLPELRTVVAPEPGPNHARNTGARAAHGEILVFCDAFDEVQPGWLEQMVEATHGVDAVGATSS